MSLQFLIKFTRTFSQKKKHYIQKWMTLGKYYGYEIMCNLMYHVNMQYKKRNNIKLLGIFFKHLCECILLVELH